jgi:signal transduction histidine kinase
MAPLAYEQIRRGMENTLLAEQKKYQKLLLQAASGMVREHNISHLCKLIVYIVKKIVKVNFAAIFLYHKEKKIYQLKAIRDTAIKPGNITFLTEHPFIAYLKNKLEPVLYEEIPFTIKNSLTLPLAISLIVPSSIENELLGFVILGEKLNREPYSEDDINVFKILSHQAAMAVENCLFFEEFKSVQQKIFTAEKLASIGGMADGVAHQIKNRLNHFSVAAGEMRYEINDFIERHCALIEQNPDLKKSFNYILDISGSIIDNVKRTDDVVRGILNYARVEEKGEFFSHFSLKEITDVSLGLVTMKHEVTEAPLECDMGADDIIYGVKPQIMECIFNLLDNHYEAIMEKRNKFSDEQRLGFNPLIKLKLTQTSDISLIEISDNGIGIKEEDKSKIFAPFFTTKSSYKSGSGIGMYVVKRIIEENHKGKISFESAYMQGTKFVIELPRK